MEEEDIDHFSTFIIQSHASNINDSLQLSPNPNHKSDKLKPRRKEKEIRGANAR
jgi:hypothetical protein